MDEQDPRDLSGFKKKSFALPYGGGEIWFEHLDGVYIHEALVLEKLNADLPRFRRPSMTSLICFVLSETALTPAIIAAIATALTDTSKVFRRVCFVGADKKSEHALRVELRRAAFAIAFMEDLEKAKEWLVREAQ